MEITIGNAQSGGATLQIRDSEGILKKEIRFMNAWFKDHPQKDGIVIGKIEDVELYENKRD